MWAAAIVDVVVGVVVGSAGVVVLVRRGRDAVGLLLVFTCAVWFAGSLAVAGISALSTVGVAVQFLHRGVLFNAVLLAAVPWALVRRLHHPHLAVAMVVVICSGYLVSAVRPVAAAVVPTLLVGAAIAAAIVVRARQDQDHARRVAWWCTAAGLLLWVGAATVMRWVPDPTGLWRVIGYDAGIVVCAVAVSRAVLPRVAVPDRVLQYAAGTVSSVEEALGLALGDQRLRVGFSDADVFRSDEGAVVSAAPGQVETIVDVGDQGKVLLTHRDGLLDDRRVRAEVIGFVRMLAEQHRLRERLAAQTAAVRVSRDRLQRSEDRAAMTLGAQIEVQVATVVRELRGQLSSLRQPVPDAGPLLNDILAQLALSAEVLNPSSPDRSLVDTLRARAAQSPLPVDLELVDVDVPVSAGRALSFVASEAMANAAKHSTSDRLKVQLAVDDDGQVVLAVTDNGCGGARFRPGGGLEGLQQRMSDIGGILTVEPGIAGGTVVSATLPPPRAPNESLQPPESASPDAFQRP